MTVSCPVDGVGYPIPSLLSIRREWVSGGGGGGGGGGVHKTYLACDIVHAIPAVTVVVFNADTSVPGTSFWTRAFCRQTCPSLNYLSNASGDHSTIRLR